MSKAAAPSTGGDYPLSLLLAALAGAVDAVGVVHWHGLFVSFMSGNSTILGAASARGDWTSALVSLSVIAGFVAGVVMGEGLGAAIGTYARAAILIAEAILLGMAAAASSHGMAQLLIALPLSLAMGVQTASVHHAGGISVALTYVTGTLVHVGRGIAAALRGTGGWPAVLPYLGLWVSLVAGSAVGAVMALRSEEGALTGAALAALILSLAAAAMAWDRDRLPRDAAAS